MAKRNIIEGAMRNHLLVMFFMIVIIAFGIYALPHLNKNEFPDVTIRTGVVAVVYPGATAEEIEERVAGRVEQYLFTFADVDKSLTHSYSKDGMLYVMTNLVPTVKDAPVTWARIREGMQLLNLTELPKGVVATAVIDDFGNASSLLLAIESPDRSSRELKEYADGLSDYLRRIPEMANIKVVGEQKEEIAIHIDPAKMTQYAISPSMISAELAAHSFRTIAGQVDNEEVRALVHVNIPYSEIYELQEMIIFSDPITGQVLRLRDVATIERRYKPNTKYVTYAEEEDPVHCLILTIEMRPGNNVVAFGAKVDKELENFLATVPPDVKVHKITDQPKNVNRSVLSFMKDLVEAVLVVILVMLFLFPLRTALVSSTSVPVCIAATFAIMYLFGIELNTVTLAALIVVLGMIVDDSVVVIDGYTDLLSEGHSRWFSAAKSTKALFGSMLIATCSISGMFFPMIPIMNGSPLGDFVRMFPVAIFITLGCSFIYAILVIPYMSARMIRPTDKSKQSFLEQIQSKFFGWLQGVYAKALSFCFRHKWGTVIVAGLSVIAGVYFFTRLNIQLLPKAERDSFAVEIHLEASCDVRETAEVVDSLVRILQADERVTSITSFIGQSSPRFHITYAPQMASDAYAQLIVNTVSDVATKEMMATYPQKYEGFFQEAQIRFKQMDYQAIAAPIEFHLKGLTYESILPIKDSLVRVMKQNPNLFYVHSDFDETTEVAEIMLHPDEANRLGITQAQLSVYLAGSLSGSQLSLTWEGSYDVPISVYTEGVSDLELGQIGDLLIPCAQPGTWVPLRQIADIVPRFHHDNLPHRNGVRSITVAADVVSGAGQLTEQKKLGAYLDSLDLPEGVTWEPGGIWALTASNMPPTILAIIAAVLVMFLVLIIHYGEIGISTLAISQSLICLFGAMFGLWLFGLDFSITAILGVISLVGIIVRNAIIMYDYAGELRSKQHMPAHQAAYEAGLRRMRPIFLTSATTALGVVPMILAKTLLWEPLGVVICFGTLFTLPIALTVLPVTYCLVFDRTESRRKRMAALGDSFQKGIEAHENRIQKFRRKHNMIKVIITIFLLAVPAAALTQFDAHAQIMPQAAQEAPDSQSTETSDGSLVLTLDDCLELAQANSVAIQTAQLDIARAREVKHQMFAKYFPQVSGNFTGYHAFQNLIGIDKLLGEDFNIDDFGLMRRGISVGARAVQPVFAGGRIVTANQYAKLGIEVAELQAEVSEREALEEVQSTYLLVQGLQEKVATVEAAMTLLDSLDNIVAAGKRAGVLEPTDALKLDLKRNEMRAKQLQLNNGIRLASELLCVQIGIDYPAGGLKLESVEDITPNCVPVRPEYRLLELNVMSEKYKKRLTLGESLPTIAVGATAFYGDLLSNGSIVQLLTDKYAQFRGNGLVFVTMSIPITGWWETSMKLRQHNIDIRKAELMRQDLSRKLDLREQKYGAEMMEAQALLESDKAALRMAEENYRLAEINYRAGMATMTEVLEANALLLQAQNAITDRRITFLDAKRRWNQ